MFIQAVGNYCKVKTTNKEILVREKISEFENILNNNDFIRTHKSFIVANKHIEVIEGNRIRMGEFEVPIGKHYKMNIDNLLK